MPLTDALTLLGYSGCGIYLAEWARYCNGDPGNGNGERQYFSIDASSGRRQLLLVKALAGKSREFGEDIMRKFTPSLLDNTGPGQSRQVRNAAYDSKLRHSHNPAPTGTTHPSGVSEKRRA